MVCIIMQYKNFYIDVIDNKIEKFEINVLETRTYKTISMFCHQLSSGKFQIVEDRSKLMLCNGNTLKDAFCNAKKMIDDYSPEKMTCLVDKAIKIIKDQYKMSLEPNVLDIFA